MSFTLADLELVRKELEKIDPDVRFWKEARRLYDSVSDFHPEGALSPFASGLDMERPEAVAVVRVIAPYLDAITLNHLVYQASRRGYLDVLEVCWPRIHERVQDQMLHEAGRKQDTEHLEWVLAQRDFSQDAMEEALMNAVWQGGMDCTDALLELVEKPWRILDDLRRKGDPKRLLKNFDAAWAAAINEGRAVVPNGRVVTPKFQADMPGVSQMSLASRMDKALPHTRVRVPKPGGRL